MKEDPMSPEAAAFTFRELNVYLNDVSRIGGDMGKEMQFGALSMMALIASELPEGHLQEAADVILCVRVSEAGLGPELMTHICHLRRGE
jgi:hypothetical protein